ncbi:hypothetical protein F751_0834 [Auxenochlorella protothecoides]|uniref:Uncharacterized protein n=1 Tax=Auxenochlorella protothecoides TaxID=3075 RepID=A0A087SBI1_AUXPR|nr:hypothetical protein F751_0834 [Auxenochlorella protothecoides]KFM23085.1 hypothetical protein F751_0834 [Auxenochlorella protothecoides]
MLHACRQEELGVGGMPPEPPHTAPRRDLLIHGCREVEVDNSGQGTPLPHSWNVIMLSLGAAASGRRVRF